MDNNTTEQSAEDKLDAALRAKLREAFEQAIADPRALRAITIGRKFANEEVAFGTFGRSGDVLEIIDAQSIDAGARTIIATVAAGLEDTEGGWALITESTDRIAVANARDRVPHAWAVAYMMSIEKQTGGKVKLIAVDENGAAYMGCGDPDCDNCGGDGSLLKDSKESAPQNGTPPEQSGSLLH